MCILLNVVLCKQTFAISELNYYFILPISRKQVSPRVRSFPIINQMIQITARTKVDDAGRMN